MRALGAQLGARISHKHTDRILEHIDILDHAAERSAGDDLLLIGLHFLHIDTRQTVEFALGFFHQHPELSAQAGHVREPQVLHGAYAVRH